MKDLVSSKSMLGSRLAQRQNLAMQYTTCKARVLTLFHAANCAGSARDSGCSTKTGFGPFPGSRLGKALAGGPSTAYSGAAPPSAGHPGSRSSSLCSTGTAATASGGGFVDSSAGGSGGASFTAGCAKMLAPFRAAKQAPAWRADSGGCGLSINPHLARWGTVSRGALESTSITWIKDPLELTSM